MLDLNSHISVAQSLAPRQVDVDGTVNGTSVDLANFDAAAVVGNAGLWATDGSYLFAVEEADDDGTGSPGAFVAVAAADLDGAFVAVTATTNDSLSQQVGYIGNKRHIRATITTSGNVSGTLQVSADVVRGKGRKLT